MLHFETVEPRTLEVLKTLQALPSLKSFALLGGTSLALRFGHRTSEDLDLFSNEYFTENLVIEELERTFTEVVIQSQEVQTIKAFIHKIKVEIISPKKSYLKPIEIVDGLKLFSLEDTMSFKMNAIETRGSKKDFFDLYEALNVFTLCDLISFYKEKFKSHDIAHLLKSITYFDDAEQEATPKLLKHQNWEDVKAKIRIEFEKYIHSQLDKNP